MKSSIIKENYDEYNQDKIEMINDIFEDDTLYCNIEKNIIKYPIPFAMESLGTKNLLNMLPSFFYAIENSSMLIIDEFSSAFHNELEELLIKYFFENSNNSQLFIVSHSTNIIKNHIYRPEQIYVTELNSLKGTKVKQVSDSNPRLSQNLERLYLGGTFGGIPRYDK